ncbi:ERF family protein [Actinoplanes teichomyceticus]|uniref:ERF superfamily protein n=1 Tax=Actinoplanes teichomyceticus TaxID=1867 RepID=A0A561WAW1_ACTTI|nr:ERF family protein [Actinoplanes teichomyceticus]TWG21002.1 ERF superfamily protein [Actinoplanes teichomyceticus]GIF14823.1 hypothetical protein Ate01nite_48550 [Actinoplanes teichomyceticus]
MIEPKNIDEAMLAFQADPPVLIKDKAAHQSKYADLVQANAVILPKLNALGVVWRTWTGFLDDGKFALKYKLLHVASGTFQDGVWPLKLSDNPQQTGSQATYARRYALTIATGVAAEGDDDDGAAAAGQRYAQRANQRQQRAAAAPAAEGPAVQRTQRPQASRPPLPGESPDGKVDQKQMRHMHALWNELGYGGEENRETRLSLTARVLGLAELNSSSDLTREQADQVIAALIERRDRQRAEAGQ